MADYPTTATEDRFLRILRDNPPQEVDLDPNYDENRPFQYLLADVWLDDKELADLESRAVKNGGAVTAKHSRVR